VKKHERAQAGAVHKLNLREIKNNVFLCLSETLNVGPDAGDIRGVEIIINFMLLGHETLPSDQGKFKIHI
jgi:hypothetical protein